MISVIVPVYNESANLETLYSGLVKVLEKLSQPYEILFINDGSKDQSQEIITRLSQENQSVKYIEFSRNFGHQIALSAGIDFAKGDKVVFIDADGQDPPEAIEDLYLKSLEGHNVVYAKRRSRDGETWFKKWTAKRFYRLLNKLTNIDMPVDTGDFRIIDKTVLDQLRSMPERHKFLRGQIAWIGLSQSYIEFDRKERGAGKSGYSFSKMLKLALDGITSFSNIPLKIATFSGFIFAIIGFFLIAYTLYSRFILDEYQPGWASQMITIVFIGGIQLIGIGIIGEYISRMNENIQDRPLYIVRETNIKK
jgi:glycosyltransferase involved in cell wall biosynthesis